MNPAISGFCLGGIISKQSPVRSPVTGHRERFIWAESLFFKLLPVKLQLHRRLLVDDHFGVGEPLNETGSDGEGLIVRGKIVFMYFVLVKSHQP